MIKRTNTKFEPKKSAASPQGVTTPKVFWGEKLTKNVLMAALLLCCLISARDIAVSPETTILASVQNAVKSEWDENLGRLIYVNSAMSDAIAVFSSPKTPRLSAPSTGKVVSVYSYEAPYLVYQNGGAVTAVAAGEVMSSVKTEYGYAVRIFSEDGIEYLYHGLKECFVKEGDHVPIGALLGDCKEERLYFEMRKNGASIDPSAYVISAQVQ